MEHDIVAKKRAFAIALMADPGNAFNIAFKLFPRDEDTSLAIEAANTWKLDPVVLDQQAAAIKDPAAAGILADKHQTAAEILERARKCDDPEVYAKIMRLYADVMGHIDKAGTGASVAVNVTTKVLMMPHPLSKNEWSEKAVIQQRDLTTPKQPRELQGVIS